MLRICILLCMGASGMAAAEDWGPVQFLVGEWHGTGTGGPGDGGGGFSFLPDLQAKVLVRKSFAEYPAQNGRPAFRHDDLMVVYRESGALRAIYFDSEGHVIRYGVQAVDGGAAFVSEGGATGPRYRLTYIREGATAVRFKFEIALPGKDFQSYIDARLRRNP